MATGKRVIIVCSVPITEPVIRNRLTPFFTLLQEKGHRVDFVCPASEGNEAQVTKGVVLHEVPIEFSKPDSLVSRAVKEANDVRRLLKHSKSIQGDLWLLSMPSMFMAFLAPVLMRKRRVFLDIRDLIWEYIPEKTLLHRLSKRGFRLVFRLGLNFFDHISVTNRHELDFVTPLWCGRQPPMLVSNGVSGEQFEKLGGLKIPSDGPVTVLYVGNVGLNQQLKTLVETAQKLPQVSFRIVGSGIDLPHIQALVEGARISNVTLTGRVPWSEVRQHYDDADILYGQLTPECNSAVPSKLYEYLATGKYVIFGVEGEAAHVLERFEHCEVVEPYDVAALSAAIRRYEDERRDVGISLSLSNRKRVGEDFIREVSVNKLVELI